MNLQRTHVTIPALFCLKFWKLVLCRPTKKRSNISRCQQAERWVTSASLRQKTNNFNPFQVCAGTSTRCRRRTPTRSPRLLRPRWRRRRRPSRTSSGSRPPTRRRSGRPSRYGAKSGISVSEEHLTCNLICHLVTYIRLAIQAKPP